MDTSSNKKAEVKTDSVEREENESVNGDQDDKKENDDSGPEENIPEINIESADEDDQKSEKHSDSENESQVAGSGDRKGFNIFLNYRICIFDIKMS